LVKYNKLGKYLLKFAAFKSFVCECVGLGGGVAFLNNVFTALRVKREQTKLKIIYASDLYVCI